MKNSKPTLLETLHDNKPGPPPEPVMWRAIYRVDEYARIEVTIGPVQTWFAARELARIEFTRELGRYVEADTIHVHQMP